jgi:hypothetical protein
MLRLGIAVILLHRAVSAQEYMPLPDRSAVPSNGRYEIVQSPVLTRLTFKLDRFTGNNWQLVVGTDGVYSWQPTPVEGLSSVSMPTAPRFQIFLSGRMGFYTYLLDCQTGQTWWYMDDKITHGSWRLMANTK